MLPVVSANMKKSYPKDIVYKRHCCVNQTSRKFTSVDIHLPHSYSINESYMKLLERLTEKGRLPIIAAVDKCLNDEVRDMEEYPMLFSRIYSLSLVRLSILSSHHITRYPAWGPSKSRTVLRSHYLKTISCSFWKISCSFNISTPLDRYLP